MTEDRTYTDTSMDPRPSSPTDILEELVTTLQASLMPASIPPSASGSPMAMPTVYAGDSVECGGFLLQMALYIEMQPQKFPTEWSKVAFLISLLSGRALLWARAIWNANSVIINGYEDFTNHFKCSARLPEHSRSRISYCACARALLPPTSTPCNSELWLRLVDGMRWLFSAPTKIGVTKHLFVTAEGAALA